MAKSGMSRETGKLITGTEYLRQRLHDVITTPKASIVGRRNFGSDFYQLVDRNVDAQFYMNAYIKLSEAINDPENGLDDFILKEMIVQKAGDAHYDIIISGLFDNEPVDINGLRYG